MKESSSSETRAYSSAWAPDPVTGYYRPENCGAEIDAAELREMLLNHRANMMKIPLELLEFDWKKIAEFN
ncbi:hypothetical protein Goari_003183 [Gossypium aridum]|uniref:Uncharacterized protein n=1 Tax=Gossypium aridum TaxID=34290 RepID=A0A7J8YAS8_GOSAI|nr:hypothetical protein [Gossypium aridum]